MLLYVTDDANFYRILIIFQFRSFGTISILIMIHVCRLAIFQYAAHTGIMRCERYSLLFHTCNMRSCTSNQWRAYHQPRQLWKFLQKKPGCCIETATFIFQL